MPWAWSHESLLSPRTGPVAAWVWVATVTTATGNIKVLGLIIGQRMRHKAEGYVPMVPNHSRVCSLPKRLSAFFWKFFLNGGKIHNIKFAIVQFGSINHIHVVQPISRTSKLKVQTHFPFLPTPGHRSLCLGRYDSIVLLKSAKHLTLHGNAHSTHSTGGCSPWGRRGR